MCSYHFDYNIWYSCVSSLYLVVSFDCYEVVKRVEWIAKLVTFTLLVMVHLLCLLQSVFNKYLTCCPETASEYARDMSCFILYMRALVDIMCLPHCLHAKLQYMYFVHFDAACKRNTL